MNVMQFNDINLLSESVCMARDKEQVLTSYEEFYTELGGV